MAGEIRIVTMIGEEEGDGDLEKAGGMFLSTDLLFPDLSGGYTRMLIF
jgi:hypothetical protein